MPGRGVSLIEGLIASVILGIAVVGILGPISASYKNSEGAEHASLASTLARQLLDEISSKPFADPDGGSVLGPEAGELSRASFDNLDDYHGFSDSSAANAAVPIRTTGGTAVLLNQHGVFQRNVLAEYHASPQGAVTETGDFLLVTVTVYLPDGSPLSLRKMFTRYPRRFE